MKINTKFLLSFLVWLLSTIVWGYTFYSQLTGGTEQTFRTLIIVRLCAFLIGVISACAGTIILIKNRNLGLGTVRFMQLISITTALISFICSNEYDRWARVLPYSTLSMIGYLIFFSSGICLVTLLIGTVASIQRRKSLVLMIVNIIVSAKPLFELAILLFLLGIGFGPPS